MSGRRHLFNLLWTFLFPLSFIWAVVTFFRRKYYPREKRYRATLTVLCVGNIHSGGSGKTPMVIEITEHFRARRPVIISRGYKGTLSAEGGRVEVSAPDGPRQYGDEPWMLAHRTRVPVYIGRDRIANVKRLEAEGEEPLVILDDGFQSLSLYRNCDIVLINTARQLDDSYCLPWGSLREPFSSLKRASALVLTGADERRSREWKGFLNSAIPSVPVFEVYRRAEGLWGVDGVFIPAPGERLGAFCGIADPQSFREDLSRVPQAVFLKAYPDHHDYGEKDIETLLRGKRSTDATALVTTDKDWFKAQPLLAARGERVYSLRIRYEIPDEFWYFLHQRLENG